VFLRAKGKKYFNVIFDHKPSHEAEDKKKKKKKTLKKKKKPKKKQLREKKERTNRWVPSALTEPPGWLV